MNIFLYGILIYFAWMFIFRFLVPLFRAGRQIKKSFREMHEHVQQMNQQTQQTQQQHNTQTGNNSKTAPKPPASDYIDFEEIK